MGGQLDVTIKSIPCFYNSGFLYVMEMTNGYRIVTMLVTTGNIRSRLVFRIFVGIGSSKQCADFGLVKQTRLLHYGIWQTKLRFVTLCIQEVAIQIISDSFDFVLKKTV